MPTVTRLTHATPELAEHMNALLDDDVRWDAAQAERFFADPNNALFVAFEGERPIAFLSAYFLQRFDNYRAEILFYEIGTHEHFRRLGAGRLLLEACKAWGRERGADNVWVLAYTGDELAMSFYRGTGGDEDEDTSTMFTYPLD
jgi:GNAT superfamily N-acetyltransferase